MTSSSLNGFKPDAIKRDHRIWFGCVSIIPLTLSLALLVASLRFGISSSDLNSLSGYLIGGLLTVAVLVPTGYGLIVGNSAVRVQSGRILRAPPVEWFSVLFVPTLVITISACLLGSGYTDTTIDVPLLTAQMAGSVLLAPTLLVMIRISKLMESDRAPEVDDACRTADEKFRAALRGLSGAMS